MFDYLVLEFDSTGVEVDDLIIGVDYKLVVSQRPIKAESRRLECTSATALRARLEPWMEKLLKKRGDNSEVYASQDVCGILADVTKLVNDLPSTGIVVGHRITQCGLPLLAANLAHLLPSAQVPGRGSWDVGLWHEAMRAGIEPAIGESINEFFRRIDGIGLGRAKLDLTKCLAAEGLSVKPDPMAGSPQVQEIEALFHHQIWKVMQQTPIEWDQEFKEWSFERPPQEDDESCSAEHAAG